MDHGRPGHEWAMDSYILTQPKRWIGLFGGSPDPFQPIQEYLLTPRRQERKGELGYKNYNDLQIPLFGNYLSLANFAALRDILSHASAQRTQNKFRPQTTLDLMP